MTRARDTRYAEKRHLMSDGAVHGDCADRAGIDQLLICDGTRYERLIPASKLRLLQNDSALSDLIGMRLDDERHAGGAQRIDGEAGPLPEVMENHVVVHVRAVEEVVQKEHDTAANVRNALHPISRTPSCAYRTSPDR